MPTTLIINDDGTVEGYLPLPKYAESIGITDLYARTLVSRGQLETVTIKYGSNKTNKIHLVKNGTIPTCRRKKGRPKKIH